MGDKEKESVTGKGPGGHQYDAKSIKVLGGLEAVRLRRREHRGAELADHRVDDLLVRAARLDLACDLGLHLDRECRVRLVEGRVALDADEARLEVRLARTRCARSGGRRHRPAGTHPDRVGRFVRHLLGPGRVAHACA